MINTNKRYARKSGSSVLMKIGSYDLWKGQWFLPEDGEEISEGLTDVVED